MITLIAARDRNGAIGRNGDIPWSLPADLALFQRETKGGALIMGRRTWDSLPVRPLKGRLNIVVSSDPSAADIVVPSVEAAIHMAQNAGHTRIYGIGGGGIYAAMLPLAHRLLLTEVDTTAPDADTFFPAFAPNAWHPVGTCVLCTSPLSATAHEYLRIAAPLAPSF